MPTERVSKNYRFDAKSPFAVPYGEPSEWVPRIIEDPNLTLAEKITVARLTALVTLDIGSLVNPASGYRDWVESYGLGIPVQRELMWLDLFLRDFYCSDRQPSEVLLTLAEQEPAERFAALTVAQLYSAAGNNREAAAWFEKEARAFKEAEHARLLALIHHLLAKQYDKIDQLLEEPAFKQLAHAHFMRDLASSRHNWAEVLYFQTQITFQTNAHLNVSISFLALVIWLMFLFRVGQISRNDTNTWVLCLCAIPAGVFATVLAVVISEYLAKVWDMVYSVYYIKQLVIIFFRVGLNEEFTKLLMFIPFLPFLLKRDSEKVALIVAACVGLGFAVEENLNYYDIHGLIAAPVRLITANLLHVALTGVLGQAVYLAIKGSVGLFHVLRLYALAVFLHTVNNLLLLIGTVLFYVIIAYLARLFARKADVYSLPSRDFSLLRATLYLGFCLLSALILIIETSRYGFAEIAPDISREVFTACVMLVVANLILFRKPKSSDQVAALSG
jgi:RsiW-degrading membrane proteinase PrsW (M82 family)